MKKYIFIIVLAISIIISPLKTMAEPVDRFLDIKGHWAEQDIKMVTQLGYMQALAYNQDAIRFAPDANVNRAQLASVLMRLFQLDYGATRFIKEPLVSDYYKDVNNDAWYAEAALVCSLNNIFTSVDSFYPDKNVTRIELAQAIKNSFTAKGINVPMIMLMPLFEDTQNLNKNETNAMVFVNNTGIMKGAENQFYPYREVTRGELAMVIKNCLKLLELNESYHGQDISIKEGQHFIVSLESNPSTGYDWSLKPWNKDIVEEQKNIYFEPINTNIYGEGGRNYWVFKAIQPGEVELNFVYSRPWESKQSFKEFRFKVIIEPENNQAVKIVNRKIIDFSPKLNVNIKVPVISGMDNQIIQSSLNNRLQEKALSFQKELISVWEEYAKLAEIGNAPLRPFELASDYQIGLNSENLLSLYIDYYQYTGGAHGITVRIPYNFDLNSGKQLALKDLFSSRFDYAQVLNREINQQIKAHPENYYDNLGFVEIREDQEYYLQDGNLIIYYGQYEIAPYAAGIPQFKIPLQSLAEGLNTSLF